MKMLSATSLERTASFPHTYSSAATKWVNFRANRDRHCKNHRRTNKIKVNSEFWTTNGYFHLCEIPGKLGICRFHIYALSTC